MRWQSVKCVECTNDDLRLCEQGEICKDGLCTPASCGDGKVGTAEDCEGSVSAIQTCESLGKYVGGELSCKACKFDTSKCYVSLFPHPAAPENKELPTNKAQTIAAHTRRPKEVRTKYTRIFRLLNESLIYSRKIESVRMDGLL